MRSLLAAILSLFLPGRGVHRADPALARTSCPPPPAYSPVPARRPRLYLADVIAADAQPLVRPYVVVWERERDERERWRLQRERRRAAVLATLGQDYLPWEVAV
ncbi:hypothetical protein [Streptomyces fulvoviolaceus]|uniref:hypothetical protein n=1 Tax=Streptomyces fulvoviolaceus TaxID=285535 RepID=UPI0021BF7DB3|nr:hypothetical protein [Streptomyces fulvoviolaceus]MCT9077217.1 hypothetical protein [Streptomyces fulvoviolaceus]